MEEMSYAEIAKTIGASEASLRGKVFRSLKLLREAASELTIAPDAAVRSGGGAGMRIDVSSR